MSCWALTKFDGREGRELAGSAAGGGAGGAPTCSRLTGALRRLSIPGVRLSLGTGDSALGLKVGRCAIEGTAASEFWRSSAARDVMKPTGGRPLGGAGLAEGVVVPCVCGAGRG